MTPQLLDEGNLILIAATVSASTADDVLARADVGALARTCAAIDACDDHLDVAATALVEVATQRPFGAASNAVAWLACALAAPDEAAGIATVRSDAVRLVQQAARGDATADDVREHLATQRLRRCPMCPACGRVIGVDATGHPRSAHGVSSTRIELVARCAVEHGAHGRFGETRPQPAPVEDTCWRPVVENERTGALLVLADFAALLLVPKGGSYAVIEPTFTAGDLVGDWGPLVEDAEPSNSVADDAVVFDARRSMIDWHRLDDALRRAHAVT